MANTISQSFITQFDADVKLAYQRGQLLRGTVRTKEATGSTCRFQKIGKGTATDKARNGNVVPMNPDHSYVTATLVDKYAPEYIDVLDELKQNIAEREAMIMTSVRALQRVADQQILDVLEAFGGSSATYGGTGLTISKISEALYEILMNKDVPDDGNITVVIGWKQYGELMQLQQFSGWEYVGDRYPYLKGSQAVRWMNCLWIPHSGTSNAYGSGLWSSRRCFAYHKTAIGHAIGQEIKNEINYIPEKAAWLINSFLSQGAVKIDTDGIVGIPCYE